MRAVGRLPQTLASALARRLAKTSPGFTGTATNRVPLACGGGTVGGDTATEARPCEARCSRPGSTKIALRGRPWSAFKVRTSYGNLAGDENGLAESNTKRTSMCRSVVPSLETCIAVPASGPITERPAAVRVGPLAVFKVCSPAKM